MTMLKDDSMNSQLKQFKTSSGKNNERLGIGMKIKFECPKCHKTWSSAYGNTQWFYKLDIRRKKTGGLIGCALFLKVHTYT